LIKKNHKLRISVVGLGFVGLSLAVTNASQRFPTVGIDINKSKIENLKLGNPTFYEPQLKKILNSSLKSNKIRFTTNLNAIVDSDITFLTVGTPSKKSGKMELSYIKNAIKKINKILQKKKSHHLLIVKSTLTPLTTENVILPIFQKIINTGKMDLVVNPEFLREGKAIKDILEPHLIVIGQYNKKSGDLLEKYYRSFYQKLPEIIRTDLTTAELIKYANNAFLATKISFINSIANICQKIPEADVNTVAHAIGKDSRIGPLFLNAGPGFGGSCLPKDLNGIIKFSDDLGDLNKLFKAVKQVNDTQPDRIIELMKEMKVLSPKKTVSILGLAFKKDTDDIREAVSEKLVRKLLKHQVKVKVNDPLAIDNFRSLFGNKISYFYSVKDCLKNSDCCVLLTEWNVYKKLTLNDFRKMKKPNVIDARRILSPEKFSKINFKAIGLGNEKIRKRSN